ncbi:MAG: hypothetical protein ACK5MP_09410 [Nostocoides sp.]
MRSTLDKTLSAIGIALAVVLLVAGALLTWASSFIGNEVHQQLTEQNITMPEEDELTTEEQKDNLAQYAGSPLDTGPEAKAYADYYIKVHMNEMADGKTYGEVSGEYLAAAKTDPTADSTKQLGELRTSLFMGDTLRGLLLYGYAFATIGTVAGYASWAAYLGALVFLILGILGYRHAKMVASQEPKAPAAPTAS